VNLGQTGKQVTAEYDSIALQYQQTKKSPLRRFVESYTLLDLIGGVSGLSVLDLACGEGLYTRKVKERGAARVLGVDISPAMIALAEDQERSHPLGIEYVCCDVRTMPDLGLFDLVIAAYLLHYAPGEAELAEMCERIASHLGPGGRFISLNENPQQSLEQYAGYTQYGFNKNAEAPLRDGSPITYWLVSGREMISFTAFFYCTGTYERVFRAAGLTTVQWHALKLSEEGLVNHGPEYWKEYMSNPPVVGIECRR
jgi:2-polyprenyl-3-methyl-5-hydroxy-6-metoxy-1,4-benzoquinol methylase